MGKLLCKLWSSRKVTVLIIGPHQSGKTTVLHKLNLGNIVDSSDGYLGNGHIETLTGENVEVASWNAYASRCPGTISMHYKNVDAVIFVVKDCGDTAHMKIAKLMFQYLETYRCKDAIVAVAVNKTNTGDEKPLTIEEIYKMLRLDECPNTCKIFPVVALTGEGLDSVQDWLSQELAKKFTYQSVFQNSTLKQDKNIPVYTKVLSNVKELFSQI